MCPVIKIGNRLLMAGDGIKVSKEALKMPGVKKLHQESDNSGKALATSDPVSVHVFRPSVN